MNSKFYRQHQVALLVGSDVCLADILYNRHALCYFLEVCMYQSLAHVPDYVVYCFDWKLLLTDSSVIFLELCCRTIKKHDF